MSTGPDGHLTPHVVEESIEDLYEHAPCGYISTCLDGRIIRANTTFAEWTGYDRSELASGRKIQDLLTPGSRIFHETHLTALLRVTGEVREIAAEIQCADGSRLPVLFNAVSREVDGPAGITSLVRYALLGASERRSYERELLEAKREAEAALARVRKLESLLPVCAWCKKIRSEGGQWKNLEEYLQASGAQVTHGICESCAKHAQAE